jgi:actin-like ATPase involved in cell morphogenesis
LVTGLPIAQYQQHKDELRERIMACSAKVGYNGHARDVRIVDCLVRPQGVLGNGLSVDIGGRTTDIALVVNGQLEYAKTLYEGMILLYSRIMDAINTKYGLTLPDHYAQTILTEGLILKDEKQNIDFVLPILSDYVDRVVDEIVLSSAVSKAILLGGGAKLLYAAIAKRYPSILAAEPQFTNAHLFRKVGEKVWS